MTDATEDGTGLAHLASAIIGPILLGMILVPVRELTSASNFTFLFLLLTIVAGELGGRRAAVVAALTSALSLDFFLTRPYLKLTIEGKHDIIAFFGLAACGLVAAAFGTRRGPAHRSRAMRAYLDALHASAIRIEESGPPGGKVEPILEAARLAFPVSALVVRNERGEIVAQSTGADVLTVPSRTVRPDTLLPVEGGGESVPLAGLPLSGDGGRLPLRASNRDVGRLELWGNGRKASPAARRALSDAGRVIGAILLASSHPPPREPDA